jgi:hypothetical protein
MKAGICVSTVSIVGGCDTGQVADGADGTDGIFLSCSYPNDPASGPAFPAEGNVDAQCPQERLRATQAASECAGIFGPQCARSKGRGCSGGRRPAKSSAALPIHQLRSAMMSRARAATGSASMARLRPCDWPRRRERRSPRARMRFHTHLLQLARVDVA